VTIEELLIIEELRNLRQAYSAYYDTQDIDNLVSLFTEDAVCEFGKDYGVWRGRQEIRANYLASFKPVGSCMDALHVITNPWIKVTAPDQAHGRCYLIDLLTRQKPVTGLATPGGHANPLLYLGIYEDDYRKVGGRWLISHTTLHFLWPERSFDGLRDPCSPAPELTSPR
jgi:hypothetical protein